MPVELFSDGFYYAALLSLASRSDGHPEVKHGILPATVCESLAL